MKRKLCFGVMLIVVTSVHGTPYTENFDNVNLTIPEGNPVGITVDGTVSDVPAGWVVNGLTITLNLSGGYNGGLYSYMVAPNGTRVLLLDQPGAASANPFGYAGSGLNVALSDGAVAGIQTTPETAGVQFAGMYQAAGTLADFNGSAANGAWQLYFADLNSGGGISTLVDWSLTIATVPEPAGASLAIFGGLAGLWLVCRRRRKIVMPRRRSFGTMTRKSKADNY